MGSPKSSDSTKEKWFLQGEFLKRTMVFFMFLWLVPSLWAGTVLIGWSASYPTEAGNVLKSQLKNFLLETLLTEYFELGQIAFDAPHPVKLEPPEVLRTYLQEARRNGAVKGLYFHLAWKALEEGWALEGIYYSAVQFQDNKVLTSGVLRIPEFTLPSDDETKLNTQAATLLMAAFSQYL